MASAKSRRLARGLKDLTGQRFGRLTVLSESEPYPNGDLRWVCRCDCGTSKLIAGRAIRRGKTVSCGCRMREIAYENATHGQAKAGQPTAEYGVWRNMVGRCYGSRDKDYRYYGSRGITVCPEWRESFEAFFTHVGKRPSAKHSIDRIDNDKGYEPGNVRWATRVQQMRNRRNVRMLTFQGRTMSRPDWADEIGVTPSALRQRILTLKWTVERALTTPAKKR